MIKTNPTKLLPGNYQPSGSVSLQNLSDLQAMLVWSLVLFLLGTCAVFLVGGATRNFIFQISINSFRDVLLMVTALLATTVVMVILHEGLHGLVFWCTTHDIPRFTFKWTYASASAPGWYLPKTDFLIATLLPLVAISLLGLLIIPFCTQIAKQLLGLLVIFNASGAAGDLVVALRLSRLPAGTLSLDHGDRVEFFTPVP